MNGARQAAAAAPVTLVFYVLARVADEQSLLVEVPWLVPLLLLALSVLFGLLVSLFMPWEGMISLVAVLILGYGFHARGYLSTFALASIVGTHLAGLTAKLLSNLVLSPGQTQGGHTGGRHIQQEMRRVTRPTNHDPAGRIMETLQEFRPTKVRDEEDLEKQLYQYLVAKGFRVERQPLVAPGLKPDLRVGDCIIELKVPRGRGDLQRLMGQVEDYLEYKKCLIVYILDTGMIPWAMLKTYKRRLREKRAKVVVKSVREH